MVHVFLGVKCKGGYREWIGTTQRTRSQSAVLENLFFNNVCFNMSESPCLALAMW